MIKEKLIKELKALATDCGIEIHNDAIYLSNPTAYFIESYNLKFNERGIDDIFNVRKNSVFDFREANRLFKEYQSILKTEKDEQ
jgi:hypothetical protein